MFAQRQQSCGPTTGTQGSGDLPSTRRTPRLHSDEGTSPLIILFGGQELITTWKLRHVMHANAQGILLCSSPPSPLGISFSPMGMATCRFAGPFMNKMFVDAYSKWPEVVPLSTATSEGTTQHLHSNFATHGLPRVFVMDSGSQIMKGNGIRHIRSLPYHPSSNGLAK